MEAQQAPNCLSQYLGWVILESQALKRQMEFVRLKRLQLLSHIRSTVRSSTWYLHKLTWVMEWGAFRQTHLGFLFHLNLNRSNLQRQTLFSPLAVMLTGKISLALVQRFRVSKLSKVLKTSSPLLASFVRVGSSERKAYFNDLGLRASDWKVYNREEFP